jgi:hypothetical protein
MLSLSYFQRFYYLTSYYDFILQCGEEQTLDFYALKMEQNMHASML